MKHGQRYRSAWGTVAGLGLLLAAGLGGTGSAHAQSRFGFEHRANVKVVGATDTLRLPWAGGLNSVTVSRVELDGDGTPDLFLWDQGASRPLTFLARQGPAGWRWQYAPGYEAPFRAVLPFNARTVKLLDYDNDGRPDLWFTYAPQYAALWRNQAIPAGPGEPGFKFTPVDTQLDEEILSAPGTYTPMMLWFYMGPAFADIDGDGDIDILSYDTGASTTLTLFRNTAGVGALPRYHQEINFGGLTRCAPCASFSFAGLTSCRPGPVVPADSGSRPAHLTNGGPLTVTDLDGDGDPDLLTGQEYCNDLVRFRNDGSAAQWALKPAGLEAPFLSSTSHPARIKHAAAAFIEDVTFDGKADMVLTPWINDLDPIGGSADLYDSKHSLHLFTNVASGTTPDFQFSTDQFLQSDMIDFGGNAAPALGDLDGDGDLDLLVGNQGEYEAAAAGAPAQYRARLRFFRNVGTAQQAVFQLEDDDFGRFSSIRFDATTNFGTQELVPTLVDLDGNGTLDLVVRLRSASTYLPARPLSFLLNRAPVGRLADYSLEDLTAFYFTGTGSTGTPTQRRDNPTFCDVDGDGLPDLLLGTSGNTVSGLNKLMYFRNHGGAPDTAFALADGDFGRFSGMPAGMSPVVADFDGDGQRELLTATDDGELRAWPDLLNNPTVATTADYNLLRDELTTAFGESHLGHHPVLTAGDLNGDGIAELIVGTSSGGLRLLGHQPNGISGVGAAGRQQALALHAFPNPASASLVLEAPQRVLSAEFIGVLGQVVRVLPAEAGAQSSSQTVSVAGLAPGIYLVRALLAGGQVATTRLVVAAR